MKILTQKDLLQFKGLWHSIKQEHIDIIFSNNYLSAKTNHRYWKNGRVYRDNAGNTYQNSFYMKGWSCTRDKDYAFSWGCVTFLFDYDALKRDFKIIPLSWNYRSSACKQNFNKEREEFILSNYIDKTFDEMKEYYSNITDHIYDEYGEKALLKWQEENGYDFISYFKKDGTKKIDFNKYLKAIFIRKESFDIYKGQGFEPVLNHPLFKGFISGDKAQRNHERSMLKY